MKKITALILALLMAMLTVSAFAAGGSSQGGDDYNKTTVTTPTNTEPAFEFGISDDPDDIAKANEEVAKLAEAENPADYFGKADNVGPRVLVFALILLTALTAIVGAFLRREKKAANAASTCLITSWDECAFRALKSGLSFFRRFQTS